MAQITEVSSSGENTKKSAQEVSGTTGHSSTPHAPSPTPAPRQSAQKPEQTAPSSSTKPTPPTKIEPLQYAWFAGHVLTCIGTTIEIIAYALFQGHRPWSQVIYRATFLIIVFTYVVSLRKKLLGQVPTFFALLPLDSFQYCLLAGLWLISRGHLLKLIPYFFYSILQAGNFISTKLIPGTPTATKINDAIRANSRSIDKIVSWNNILLFLRLLLDTLLIRTGGFVSLVAYGIFSRIRIAYSPTTQETLKDLEGYVDTFLTNPKVPPKVQEVWRRAKWFIDHYDKQDLKPIRRPVSDGQASSTGAAKSSKPHKRTGSDNDIFLNGKK